MDNEATTAPGATRISRAARVYTVAGLSLAVGLAIGYFFGGPQTPAPAAPAATPARPAPAASAMGMGRTPGAQGHSPADLKQMANKQAAPLLEKLKSDPNNSALLSQIGAIYRAAQQFKESADYYNRALQADSKNVAVRNKLAASLYHGGDVDGAIAQLNQALSVDPKDANALFNLGMIKLQGKQDSKGALAAWRQLLKTNPQLSADRKAQVQGMIAQVQNMQGQPQSKQRSTEQ